MPGATTDSFVGPTLDACLHSLREQVSIGLAARGGDRSQLFIDHTTGVTNGTGVMIGGTAVIGDRVNPHQAVTLDNKSFPPDGNGPLLKGQPRHPIVEDDVVIDAGATILGQMTIGKGVPMAPTGGSYAAIWRAPPSPRPR